MALLPNEVIKVFKEEFKFKSFTQVQVESIRNLLNYKDVIVQSPTGTGKTIAYLLPIITILNKKSQEWKNNRIGALILVPSRELAQQVGGVCKKFVEKFNLSTLLLIGGKKLEDQLESIENNRATILIATPGRLEQIMNLDDNNIKKYLKSLEILIIDEADRFIDTGFQRSISEILSNLPKQRRTGLFSATQAKELEDLIKFGLRNSLRITLTESEPLKISENDVIQQKQNVLPQSLQCFYSIVTADEKFSALLEYIRNEPNSKMLIFVSTRFCVEYFKKLMERFLKKRKIFGIHGKKKKNREQQIELFKKTPKSVMLCTDLMSRGIDIEDIDCVIQFDIPRESSWFVHRAGRCARSGRPGKNLLLLTTEESGYVEFISKYESLRMENIKIKTSNALKAEELRTRTIKMAVQDRDILECGTRAFVSMIESYVKHDCGIVCGLQNLNVVGLAHAYSLLRLPRMPELKDRDLSAFKRSDEIDTSQIKFQQKSREIQRLKQRKLKNEEKSLEKAQKNASEKKKEMEMENGMESKRKRKISKDDDSTNNSKEEDWEEMASDMALLKKFKRGRLSKKELSELLDD